jgi:FkbH-like protein
MDLSIQPVDHLIRKGRSLRRELLAGQNLQDLSVAVLGGSTISEVIDLLELLLLADGFRPRFYQSQYNRFYEEAVLDPQRLADFRPDVVYLCTSFFNIQSFPPLSATASDFNACVAAEMARFQSIWRSLRETIGCQVIQNNFEMPPCSILGNLDSVSYGGRTRFVNALNLEFAKEADARPWLAIHDVHSLSGLLGTKHWFDWNRWYSYKILTTPDASLALVKSLSAIVRAIYGKSRKCLVLDLDNTLWGGEVGDDGPEKICIGRETPVAEAYTAFQEYCLALRNCGVLLAVCSKNNEDTAKQGLAHPDSVLKLNHFAAFKANWLPKHENIVAIASELNISLDSLVFVDDNPAERALVAAQLPMVAVPDVGSDVSTYATILSTGRYFEPVRISEEDLKRGDLYTADSLRKAVQAEFANYGEYLDSLDMKAEIDAFRPEYLVRIAQLTNKTNQFNLTTRRYTLAEIEAVANDPEHLTLYGKLADKFGENGLISVVIGRKEGDVLHLDLWLMSCRVLYREMELAMLDSLVERAKSFGIELVQGYYIPTAKNKLVADHYQKLGFSPELNNSNEQGSVWRLRLKDYESKTRHIRVKELVNG